MSPTLHHESTRVPVTALASCGTLLIAAEGPFLRFYHAKNSRYLQSRRVFKAQAIHGISVYSEEHDHVKKLIVWGGRSVRALIVNILTVDHGCEPLSLLLSNVASANDWILDLTPRMNASEDKDKYNQGTCAAVTAHNALLEFTIQHQSGSTLASSSLSLSVSELTTSSRSILYSAHLFWESSNCILVAAGTAFGEIMYWSWNNTAQGVAVSQIHQVFLGHEGSIFDVRISKELYCECHSGIKRVIASCSDDRTIRLWDVSNVDVKAIELHAVDEGTGTQRTRHTGFSVAAADTQSDSSNCLAIGWGHTSRVWKVRFLDPLVCDGVLTLLSAGEDATCRTWKLVANTKAGDSLPCTLQEINSAAHHSGKNMWSISTYRQAGDPLRVACGAADSKISTHLVFGAGQRMKGCGTTLAEYALQDLLDMAQPLITADVPQQTTKSSKKADSIRSYCFLDGSLLLLTNSGKILVESFFPGASTGLQSSFTSSSLLDQLEELSGYSICTSMPTYGIAFIAGGKGNIYMYSKNDSTLKHIHTVAGKVGSLFVRDTISSEGRKQLVLLVTLVGLKQAQLLYIDITMDLTPGDLVPTNVTVSSPLTGSTITSMFIIEKSPEASVILLGFRRGSVGLYDISHDMNNSEATLFTVIEKVHGDETVTALRFLVSSESTTAGHLYSVGRDGCLAIHSIDLVNNTIQLVHNLALPIGPYIEGLCFQNGHVLVHGFSSKKWVLYDTTAEEEIMGVETGGAHRSWAFQPHINPSGPQSGGTLVWTRSSSLHICSQEGPNHGVLRSGGHGREIKAVAVSPVTQCSECCVRHNELIATGAEDTDIKIFCYKDGDPVCLKTLRKHTTGIQHLKWSDDGHYLFSSAGSEEFYVWRIRTLPTAVDIGVVCEHIHTPESVFSDLRIISFDVKRCGDAYTIVMVFSDSSVKICRYDPTTTIKWQSLANGVYFTSCLTQSIFISPTSLLTAGTDGHAVIWPLPNDFFETSTHVLKWQQPIRIHQNASKTMASHVNGDGTTLIVSGGDDGALAFLLTLPYMPGVSSDLQEIYASPPVLVTRAHGSAVTACTIVTVQSHVYILTSGNDEWIRLWEVVINNTGKDISSKTESDMLSIRRLSKVKASVADVSSMAVLDRDGDVLARVLVCGVGMEIIRLDLLPNEESCAL